MDFTEIAPGVRWKPACNDGRPFSYTNTYILSSDIGPLLVEPVHFDELEAWVELIRQEQIAAIVLTHHHVDHTYGVHPLQSATGCEVWGPTKGKALRQQYTLSRVLVEGDDLGGWRVLETPGHDLEHIVLYNGGTLVAGDVRKVGTGWPHDLIKSIQRLISINPETVLFAHGLPALHHSFAVWGKLLMEERS